MRQLHHHIPSKLLTVLFVLLVLPLSIWLVQYARSVHGAAAVSSYTIYNDALTPGWQNWSWTSHVNFANPSPVYKGTTSIAFTPMQRWAGLYLYTATALDITPYTFLHFAARASRAGQAYDVMLYDGDNNGLPAVSLAHYGGNPVPRSWKVYNIPLADLRAGATHIRGVALQSRTRRRGTLYLDALSFTASTSSPIPSAALTPSADPTAPAAPSSTATTTTDPTATTTAAPSSTVDPTVTAAPTNTADPTSTAAPTGKFTTLPPGSPLPSESECAARVRNSSFEPRPDNYAANHRVPTAAQIASLQPWDNSKADSLRQQITGNFTGTTDEILQWVACKWGIDEDIVRAEAVQESYWHQNAAGDYTTDQSLCPPGTWDGSGCYQSYGILQIKYIYNTSSWSMSRDDSAFSAEYMYGIIRACYEGWTDYLNDRTPLPGYPNYHAGDIWGCVGRWFSGGWYDQDAVNYINTVQTHYTNKEWLKPGF